MIQSGNKFIQLYAIISGLILSYYAYLYKDITLFLIGITIVYRDSILLFRTENCKYVQNPVYNLSIRSGNKLVQLLATISGLYLMQKYKSINIIICIIGIIMFLGDGYLFMFEKNKLCKAIIP